MKLALALLVGLFAGIPPAFASGEAIDDFFGRWVGQGIAETEVGQDTERQVRGLEVIVRDHPTGFQLCWSTTRIKIGRPDRQTFAMMIFAPTDTAGSWKAVFSADGSATEGSARAELRDGTLRVFNRATKENGDAELQIYERRLSRGGMDLHFTRFDNDELVRVVQGRLERVERAAGADAPWC